MLLRDESAPRPPNLDMIGETPNPDDEETFRNPYRVRPSPVDQPSSALIEDDQISQTKPFAVIADESPQLDTHKM